MFRIITWILCIYLFSIECANSQDSIANEKKRLVSIQSGVSYGFVQDDIASPLVYKGINVPVFVNYDSYKHKHSHSIDLFFNYVKLKSAIYIENPKEAFYTKNYNTFLSYTYYRRLYQHSKFQSTLYAGPQLKFQINIRDHFYNNYVHYNTGEITANLGVSLELLKQFVKRTNDLFSFKLYTTILSYDFYNYLYNPIVAKDYYSNDGAENTDFNQAKTCNLVTLNKYQELQANVTYIRKITRLLGVKGSFYFQYYNTEKYDNLLYTRFINYQLLIGLTIKI